VAREVESGEPRAKITEAHRNGIGWKDDDGHVRRSVVLMRLANERIHSHLSEKRTSQREPSDCPPQLCFGTL